MTARERGFVDALIAALDRATALVAELDDMAAEVDMVDRSGVVR